MALGSTLSQARVDAGLSVDDVAAATRVRAAVIESIERENFKHCGGDVYARGHIRAIAKFLGLNAEPLISDFDHNFADEPITVAQVFDAERKSSSDSRRPNWTFAMGIGALALVGMATLSLRSSDDPAEVATTPTPSASQSVTNQTGSSPAATPITTGVEANASGVTVQMSFLGSSWFRVTDVSGAKVYEGTLRAGNVRTFNDDQPLAFVIGNAGAVRLVVNGKDLGIAGAQGEVLRVTYQPAK